LTGHAKENPCTQIETGGGQHAEIKGEKKDGVDCKAAKPIIQADR
jgi:hypothetical protein